MQSTSTQPAALAQHAAAVVARLEHPDQVVRQRAVENFGKLEPEALAEHAAAVIFAYRNKMDIALGVAIGSSTQSNWLAVRRIVL